MPGGTGEFIFIDESGDPGDPAILGASPLYLLVATHMDEMTYRDFTAHVAAFRYFHGVNREFKAWGGLLKMPPTIQWRTLMEYLSDRTVAGDNHHNRDMDGQGDVQGQPGSVSRAGAEHPLSPFSDSTALRATQSEACVGTRRRHRS